MKLRTAHRCARNYCYRRRPGSYLPLMSHTVWVVTLGKDDAYGPDDPVASSISIAALIGRAKEAEDSLPSLPPPAKRLEAPSKATAIA